MRPHRALHPSLVALVAAVVVMVSAPAVAAPGDVVWEAVSDFGRPGSQGSFVLVSPDGGTIFEVGTVFPRNPSDIVVRARAAADGSLCGRSATGIPISSRSTRSPPPFHRTADACSSPA